MVGTTVRFFYFFLNYQYCRHSAFACNLVCDKYRQILCLLTSNSTFYYQITTLIVQRMIICPFPSDKVTEINLWSHFLWASFAMGMDYLTPFILAIQAIVWRKDIYTTAHIPFLFVVIG